MTINWSKNVWNTYLVRFSLPFFLCLFEETVGCFFFQIVSSVSQNRKRINLVSYQNVWKHVENWMNCTCNFKLLQSESCSFLSWICRDFGFTKNTFDQNRHRSSKAFCLIQNQVQFPIHFRLEYLGRKFL